MDVSRRAFLQILAATPDRQPVGDVLVSIFLRGGADGLNLVPPHAEAAYHDARPSLAVSPPVAGTTGGSRHAVDLDGFFGLHPALRPLLPLYQQKHLAVVHAVGSDDQTRSHFEAQDLMDRGCPIEQNLGSGWLARHLRSRADRHSPLSAVAISDTLPESLRGSPGASSVRNVDAFSIMLPEQQRTAFDAALRQLYSHQAGELGQSGLQVLETIQTIDRLRQEADRNTDSAPYPAGSLGNDLRQVARLIKAEVGLEVACLDFGGWDTHFVQDGLFGGLVGELGQGLAAFAEDIRPFWNRVTIVTITEFGRRLHENVSLGTDHGRASVMFVLGGNVAGGRVVASWPGLKPDQLESPGDLRVTTDYRDVLGEIVVKRLGNHNVTKVFPGHTLQPRNLIRGRPSS